MVMKDVALLAGAVARSQAYLQAMVKAGICPGQCILYGESKEEFCETREKGEGNNPFFDRSESLIWTLTNAHIPYDIVLNRDINSPEMEQYLRRIPQMYIIYSGYGGSILKSHLFHMGKCFLHIHAGILPGYRGSTTAYYSILQEGFIGATAIFLNERIDEGDIIADGRYRIPGGGENIDYIYEPWVRSQVLVNVLRQYESEGNFQRRKQEREGSETYYIIHPVLKHLALLQAEGKQEAGRETDYIFTES